MRTTSRQLLFFAAACAVTGVPAGAAAQRSLTEATATVAEALAELPSHLARARSAIAYEAAEGLSYGAAALSRLDYDFGGLVILPDLPRTNDQVSDSLYRQARAALQRGAYRDAAELFMRVHRRDPRAALAADALYWHA